MARAESKHVALLMKKIVVLDSKLLFILINTD